MVRALYLAALIAILAGSPVQAQTAGGNDTATGHRTGVRHPSHSAETPVDHGPYTPESNRAYQGGGMILEGAPGAPAPTPEPTPPGQTPRNMVPQ